MKEILMAARKVAMWVGSMESTMVDLLELRMAALKVVQMVGSMESTMADSKVVQ